MFWNIRKSIKINPQFFLLLAETLTVKVPEKALVVCLCIANEQFSGNFARSPLSKCRSIIFVWRKSLYAKKSFWSFVLAEQCLSKKMNAIINQFLLKNRPFFSWKFWPIFICLSIPRKQYFSTASPKNELIVYLLALESVLSKNAKIFFFKAYFTSSSLIDSELISLLQRMIFWWSKNPTKS